MVELTVYDLMGREVQSLQQGVMTAGAHEVSFNAADLSSGAGSSS